jgi:translocation and assembly module TamB
MPGEDASREKPKAHEAQRLSTSRLLLVVVLFVALAAYSIWNSDRFQTLLQGVSQTRLSELLQRKVEFRRVSFRVFPPSVQLADVRIANDPRLGGDPFLSAEELTIGGGLSIGGGELRFGRVRAVAPRLSLVQFADGTWNLPPGLTRPASKGGGGAEVRFGELVIQQGVFELEGRKMGIDAKMEDFAVQIASRPNERYRADLECRRVTLKLPSAEPLVFHLDLKFRLDPARGAWIESLAAAGDFGSLRGSGNLEGFRDATARIAFSGDLKVEEVERVFRAELGFAGPVAVRGQVSTAPGAGFRALARITSPRVTGGNFPLEDLDATLTASANSLLARIDRARYAGGIATGAMRIENLDKSRGAVQPMTLSVDANDVSVERFFGDVGLPGTGLSGGAAIALNLHWAEGGIKRANGAASIAIAPGPASSLVRGRFGVPISGGGSLPIVDGRIGFRGTPFRFPVTTLELTGGLQIGVWTPDFDFRLQTRELGEIDRIFQNFVAAGGSKPSALGLAGSAELTGHVSRSWGNPDATAQIAAETARYGGVLFGSVRGTAEMHDGAFLFHPLRVYDGDSSLSLEGTVRFRRDPRAPTFDLTVGANAYPVARILDYLDIDLPVDGRVTGSFPISGDPPDRLSGGGAAVLENAVIWGQSVPRLTGRAEISPGRFTLDDMRAEIGGGAVGGHGSIAYREKTFEVRAAGDAIPLESVAAVQDVSDRVSGKLSFEISGSGPLDRPDVTFSAALSDARLFGRAVPDERMPKLRAHVAGGRLEGSAAAGDLWTLTATGDVAASPMEFHARLEAKDLAALMALTPAPPPEGVGGAVTAEGVFRVPEEGRGELSGDVTIQEARFDARGHDGLLRTASAAKVHIAGHRLELEPLRLVGDGIDLRVSGALDGSSSPRTIEARATGTADAGILALVDPEIGLSGRLDVEVAASGPVAQPAFSGSVRIADGRYRLAGYSFEQIEGRIRLTGSGGEIEGLRARLAEGDVFAAGSFQLANGGVSEFRVALQGRRILVRAISALRLTVDADLVATGAGGDNVIRGEVTLLRGTYTKDVDLTISDLLARNRGGGAMAVRQPWMERTSLEVRVVSAAALEVRNNLARLSGTVDLTVRGTLADPMLLGQVLLDEGGRVVFSDIRYEIEAGTITFSNTTKIAPFIDLRARADVKGYDLVVTLVGTWPRVSATFTSDPPLSNDAILGLILSGSPPDTRQAADTTGQLVSAAGGVISGAVTGGITRRTQQLFRLDRFQIDPVFEGSNLSTFRTTIGKQITQDLAVTSSIALDSSRQPTLRIEWQATNTILVQLLRDENGNITLSFRRRQRF